MRVALPTLLLAFTVAAPLHAAGIETESRTPTPEVVPVAAPEAPVAPALQLEQVQVRERTVVDDADAVQMPARGSFWWLVGVIVIAGVILAILL